MRKNTHHQSSEAAGLVTKRELAREYAVSQRTIDNWLRQGMPHLKINSRMVRMDPNDVLAWLKRHYNTRRRGRAIRER